MGITQTSKDYGYDFFSYSHFVPLKVVLPLWPINFVPSYWTNLFQDLLVYPASYWDVIYFEDRGVYLGLSVA